MPQSAKRLMAAVLAMILLAALALRLNAIHAGLPALNDPDELIFEISAVKLLREPTLNPGWFGHPATITIYLLALIDAGVFATGYLAGWFGSVQGFADAIYADPSWLILPGRVAMALFATGVVWLTGRLASELHGRAAGLVAAALLAVNPVHVVWSQVIRSDVMASFFMLLCLLAALRIARHDRWRDYVLASLWLGCAVATKWPFALAALALPGAALLRHRAAPELRARTLKRLFLTGPMALGFLLLISPYLLLDWQTLLRNLQGEAQVHHLGATGGAWWQNLWWYVSGPLRSGMGPAGMLALAAGLVMVRRHAEARAIVLPVALGFLLTITVQNLVWERWALPLMPLLAVMAAPALVWLGTFIWHRLSRPLAIVALAAMAAALLLPGVQAVQDNARSRLNDTRQRASAWARAHFKPGSTVIIEHFAFDIEGQPWRFLFPLGDMGCVDAKAWLSGKVGYSPIDAGRGGRANVDYGTLAPAQRHTCAADYAIFTQYDRYRAERARFPAEHAAYAELLARSEILATFKPEPGHSAGPVVRIVRLRR